MTASQLTALAKSSDSRVTATNITVVGTGPSVTVLAEKSATASDRDLKIDAIFLARVLIEGSSGQVEKVKALFSQPDKPGRFALVDKKVVDDYASGKLTPEQLLSSVTLTALEAEKAPDVAEGPLMERRLLVWRRIEKLREQGTGVQTFQNLFQQMEKTVSATENPEVLVQKISFLESKLTEQEHFVKQARKASQGRGIRVTARSSDHGNSGQSSAPAQTASTNQPASHPTSHGGTHSSNMPPPPWGQGQGGFPPPFPPPHGGMPGGFPPPP